MSTSIKVNWSCECRPERTTGYIDSDTDEDLYKLIACDGKGNLKLKKLFKTKELAIQQRKSWEKNYGS